METQVVKQAIHELVDKIEDRELLDLYFRLLERELGKESSGGSIFATTKEDLVNRSTASLASIQKGETTNLNDFNDDVKKWKKKKAM